MTILTANLGFPTTPSTTKLTPGDCDNDRQQEMVPPPPLSANVAKNRCCQLSVCTNVLLWSMSAKVFKLSFEYLHIYSPKSGDKLRVLVP